MVNMGDETFIAASAHFNPELFNMTMPAEKSVRFMDKGQSGGDPEDPHDHVYLSETNRKYTKAGVPGDNCEMGESQTVLDDELDIDGDTTGCGSRGRGKGVVFAVTNVHLFT